MSAINSAINAKLESNSGLSISCALKRHLSPSTVGLVSRSLPLSGNVHKMGTSITYFETQLKSGIERSKTEFKRAEIVFYPAEGSICFIHKDIKLSCAMSPIGVMIDYADELDTLVAGDVLRLGPVA